MPPDCCVVAVGNFNYNRYRTLLQWSLDINPRYKKQGPGPARTSISRIEGVGAGDSTQEGASLGSSATVAGCRVDGDKLGDKRKETWWHWTVGVWATQLKSWHTQANRYHLIFLEIMLASGYPTRLVPYCIITLQKQSRHAVHLLRIFRSH